MSAQSDTPNPTGDGGAMSYQALVSAEDDDDEDEDEDEEKDDDQTHSIRYDSTMTSRERRFDTLNSLGSWYNLAPSCYPSLPAGVPPSRSDYGGGLGHKHRMVLS